MRNKLMMQQNLKNESLMPCPICEHGMLPHAVGFNYVRFYCPHCVKEFTYSVCDDCGDLFLKDDFKLCDTCRNKSLELLW